MAISTDRSHTSVVQIAERARAEMTPLTARFSYFCAMPVADEDLKQYLHDPIAALPPAIVQLLPPVGIVLAPFLERTNGPGSEAIAFERPSDKAYAYAGRVNHSGGVTLVMAIKEEEVANYHYTLYHEIAGVLADGLDGEPRDAYHRVLREELNVEAHGEVDEQSWHLKQALLRRQSNIRKESKLFREYARQSFRDTMTLYLHGICCDIDVETGPRQLPSRYLRKRLEVFNLLFPPPEGYAVFPEQLKPR